MDPIKDAIARNREILEEQKRNGTYVDARELSARMVRQAQELEAQMIKNGKPIPQDNFEFEETEPVEFKNFQPLRLDKNMTRDQINTEVDRYLSELDTFIKPINEPFEITSDFNKIKELPKSIRKQALEKFKSRMNSQIEGMSCCRMVIQGLIDNNPNIPAEVLKNIISKFAKKYGVTSKELEKYENALKNLEDIRENIKEIRNKYTDDVDLINQINGIKKFPTSGIFRPKIKIETTAYGFVVYMNSKDAKRLHPDAGSTYGFYNEFEFENKLGYFGAKVCVICVDQVATKAKSEDTKRHELEHAKESYLEENFDSAYRRAWLGKDISLKDGVKKMEREGNFDENNFLLFFEEYCQNHFNYYLNTAIKTELIARKKDLQEDDYKFISKAYGKFVTFDLELKFFLFFESRFSKEFKDKITKIADKYKNKFFDEIQNAQSSFDKLLKEGGYSTDEAIALMSYTPVKLWSKKIERILQCKR